MIRTSNYSNWNPPLPSNAYYQQAVKDLARRSVARQRWLYSVGRTIQKNRKPVTYIDGVVHLSMHEKGKAADIVSKARLWNAPPGFWNALKQEGAKVGLHTLEFEKCHIEWRG